MKFSKKNKKIIVSLFLALVVSIASKFGFIRNYNNDKSVENVTTQISKVDYSSILDEVPQYCGNPYVMVNNEPLFTDEEKNSLSAFEKYCSLDGYGRCTVCFACIDKSLEPIKKRGRIGNVHPTGWKQKKYKKIATDDNKAGYLYNRCHLIAYRFTGENDNKKNLITGTRYLNVKGMQPIENEVASYINNYPHNHVLYRVTPIFEGNNMLASGVIIEIYTIETSDIRKTYYCYNVQPGVEIDYKNGKSY